jgi:hypothetical protein
MADDEKTLPKRPDQSRIKVTKEELEASGLSLRDYMNKQKGLTRRDGSAPTEAKAPAKAAMSNYSNEGRNSSAKNTESEKPQEDFASIKNMLSNRRARIARDNAALESGMKKGGKVKKMASGGSASSRADGIASKGKTRGKMC